MYPVRTDVRCDRILENGLRDGISTIAEFLPKLVLFLVILIVGLIVAKAISKALSALLEKVGFDRAVERGGVKKALANSKMDASDIVAKLVYYTLTLFVLQLAFGVFGPNPISDLLTEVILFIPSLVVAIIILVVASAIAAAVKALVESTPRRTVVRQDAGEHRLDLHPVPRRRRRPQPGRRRHHGDHPGARRDPGHARPA